MLLFYAHRRSKVVVLHKMQRMKVYDYRIAFSFTDIPGNEWELNVWPLNFFSPIFLWKWSHQFIHLCGFDWSKQTNAQKICTATNRILLLPLNKWMESTISQLMDIALRNPITFSIFQFCDLWFALQSSKSNLIIKWIVIDRKNVCTVVFSSEIIKSIFYFDSV